MRWLRILGIGTLPTRQFTRIQVEKVRYRLSKGEGLRQILSEVTKYMNLC